MPSRDDKAISRRIPRRQAASAEGGSQRPTVGMNLWRAGKGSTSKNIEDWGALGRPRAMSVSEWPWATGRPH